MNILLTKSRDAIMDMLLLHESHTEPYKALI